MGRMLKKGDTGDDVRRLQADLLRMLGAHRAHFAKPNGWFGPKTEAAVRMLQHMLHLQKDPKGVAGPEVQRALEYHVIEISGSIGLKLHLLDDKDKLKLTITPDSLKPSPVKRSPFKPSPSGPSPDPKPAPVERDDSGGWLAQFQPTIGPGMLTPPPFYFNDPQHGPFPGTVISSGFSLGVIYRTRKEGRHWEFTLPGSSYGYFINSTNTPSDPKYTLQIPTGVTWADLFVRNKFHLSLQAQIAALINMEPHSIAIQGAIGPQLSYDIIEDRLNFYVNGNVGPQWNLTNGQFQLGSGLLLGATLQWGLK